MVKTIKISAFLKQVLDDLASATHGNPPEVSNDNNLKCIKPEE